MAFQVSICEVVRAVLFDYGLTLVTFSFPRAELLEVLELVRPWLGPGSPEPETLMQTVLEPLERDLATIGEDEIDYLDFYDRAWRRAGLEVNREVLYRIADLEQRCWDRAIRVAPYALETLRDLRGRGIKTAVVSNAAFPPEFMHRQARSSGIAALVDAVVFSSEVGRRKPAPELYRAALERLGVAAEDAVFVGDRVREDYEGPIRLGMRAVLCTALARESVGDRVPTINSLRELGGFLDGLG